MDTNGEDRKLTADFLQRLPLQRSLYFVFLGLFCTLNFMSLFFLAQKVPNLLSETELVATHPYDWKIGVIQYTVGLPIAFMGLVSMEGSALSILSKLSPPKFRGVAVNAGTIVVFVGFVARLIGDLQLFFVGLSHRLINTDLVNAGTCKSGDGHFRNLCFLTILPLPSRHPSFAGWDSDCVLGSPVLLFLDVISSISKYRLFRVNLQFNRII